MGPGTRKSHIPISILLMTLWKYKQVPQANIFRSSFYLWVFHLTLLGMQFLRSIGNPLLSAASLAIVDTHHICKSAVGAWHSQTPKLVVTYGPPEAQSHS